MSKEKMPSAPKMTVDRSAWSSSFLGRGYEGNDRGVGQFRQGSGGGRDAYQEPNQGGYVDDGGRRWVNDERSLGYGEPLRSGNSEWIPFSDSLRTVYPDNGQYIGEPNRVKDYPENGRWDFREQSRPEYVERGRERKSIDNNRGGYAEAGWGGPDNAVRDAYTERGRPGYLTSRGNYGDNSKGARDSYSPVINRGSYSADDFGPGPYLQESGYGVYNTVMPYGESQDGSRSPFVSNGSRSPSLEVCRRYGPCGPRFMNRQDGNRVASDHMEYVSSSVYDCQKSCYRGIDGQDRWCQFASPPAPTPAPAPAPAPPLLGSTNPVDFRWLDYFGSSLARVTSDAADRYFSRVLEKFLNTVRDSIRATPCPTVEERSHAARNSNKYATLVRIAYEFYGRAGKDADCIKSWKDENCELIPSMEYHHENVRTLVESPFREVVVLRKIPSESSEIHSSRRPDEIVALFRRTCLKTCRNLKENFKILFGVLHKSDRVSAQMELVEEVVSRVVVMEFA